MQNPINWFEKLETGAKREVQVTVARQRVVWEFRILGEDNWEENTQPTAEHWDDLLQKMKDRYQRRRATALDVGLVTRLHKRAQGLLSGFTLVEPRT
jgi:hypothetical protein